ncbi:MAG: response regulator [Methylococcaceae bacterium]|nr:response regulator [Methylococcaceae bacterium]
MEIIEKKFQKEIEIERLWIATEQGRYVFFALLFISLLLVFGLWDMASHRLLLIWFGMLTSLNFCRWMVLQFFYNHKSVLTANIQRVKRFLMFSAALVGLCWGMAAVWFLVPSQPTNVMIMVITLNIEVIGGVLTWFCYLPAAIAILVPIALPLVYFLLLEGGKAYIATSLILSLLTILALKSSLNIAKMLNHALNLNFENAALRKESEEKSLLLETALENMSQGISMSDQDDRLRMWNQQFTNLLGGTGAKVFTDAKLSALLEAADPPLILSTDGGAEYQMHNGQVYEIRQAQLTQGGRVLTYTDISDRIKREQALEKANAAKTRFLAAASHDLRQPIHALGLFFAELSDRVYSPETALVIGQIDDSIAAINSMLNALLDISKLDAGVVKPCLEPAPLGELFTRLCTEFQPIALENQNELHLRPTLAIVNTDPAMLERMLRNLISNALRYTEKGRILVAARWRGQKIEIQVRDNGSGIPEDQLEEIFVEFHQLQNPARDRRQGLGLGLAIVKLLGQLLHHEVKVASRLGQGSCFSITLPLAHQSIDAESKLSAEKPSLLNNILAGRLVLVLEDDIAVLEGMRGLLTRWGCHVITAGSSIEAEEKLAIIEQPLDLLLVDYRLPDNVSGIEVARQLQIRLGYPVAVLILTGDTGPDRLREADASGYPLLHKPVQPAKLRSSMQYLLSKSREAEL